MALTFDLTEIKDQTACFGEDGQMRDVTRALVFAQLFICMGGVITDKNRYEVFRRISVYETCFGTMLSSGIKITYDDVVRHVGLKTNAFGDSGKREFAKRVMDGLMREAQAELRRQTSGAVSASADSAEVVSGR